MMSRARFNAIYSGITDAAKKVYEVVPIAEAWTVQQVAAELHRCKVPVARIDVLTGCLDSLRRAGLVCEPRRGQFRRERVRDDKPTAAAVEIPTFTKIEPEEKNMANKPQPTPRASTTPLDRLGDLAQRVTQLSIALKDVASELSDAAVDIQSQLEHGEEDVKKLRQLQTLLKSIGE